MSLATPESVQKLQAALHDKAKKSPAFRFYALYDKVYRKDVLTPGASQPASRLLTTFLGRPYSFDAYERWLNQAR